jgi:hypothetical protein
MRDKLLALLKPQASPDVKLSVVSLFLVKVLESFEPRISSLEERQLQKGDKGDKGEKGDAGKDGKDGKNGLDGRNGLDGKDGSDGKNGKTGKAGVSVVSANIAIDDHLVLTLSDGKEIDAGELPMKEGQGGVFVSGNAWQIIVSDAPPSNPPDKQLWFATNLTSACN